MRYVAAVVLIFSTLAFAYPSNGFPPEDADTGPTLMPFLAQERGLLLTLSGSNTVGAKLAPAWAAAFLKAKGADKIAVTKRAADNEYRIVGRNHNQLVYIDVYAHGSSTGFVSLEAGKADIAMASRPVKPQERERLLKRGDLFEADAEHVVAIDGLAVIVHPDNPLAQLSVDSIAAVFAGKISNWRELGGADLPIHLYARNENSGTWDTFQTLVLGEGLKLSPTAQRFESNDVLSDQVAADPSAIGFVGLASVRSARALAVRQGGTAATRPETLFVATEDYPLARRLFLYSLPTSNNSVVNEFIQFAQHEQGQTLVEQVGFVSQTPVPIAMTENSGPDFYQAFAAQARRMSLNFRFRPGSAQLDNKAKRDLIRLVNYLRKVDQGSQHIQLIGFSGTKNDPALSRVLSRLRATAVRTALFDQGVTTESVIGFGAERLLGEGRSGSSKNDRVEVWLYPSANALAVERLKAAEATSGDPSAAILKLANQP